ncbi:uncharacterized protein [Amphiura filiformis]|uniref:uncharacterized protein n=1 Tax=Amphiura filiformis TaxID=82378 RepID=UPI003B220AEE
MNGQVSTFNVRCYTDRNNPPRDINYDRPNDQRKVTVWIGLMGNNTIYGPVFFDQTVNGQRYLDMINDDVIPQLNQRFHQQQNGVFPRLWWAQDGAPAHRSREVHDRLQQLFPNRVIGIGHAQEWPARSPDLTPLDFFVWGYIKARVY